MADLRRLPLREVLGRVRAHSGEDWFLPAEDWNSDAILPTLETVAALSRPRRVTVVSGDLELATRSRLHAPVALAAIVAASVRGRGALRTSAAELRRLLQEPRVPARAGGGDGVLYVNANLWFGLKVGGSVGHVAGVVNGFREAGLPVDLLTASEPVLVRDDVDVFPLHAETLGFPLELNYYRFSHLTARQAARRADPSRHRVLYQRMSVGNYAGVVTSRRSGLPLVLEYNGSEVWAARNWGTPLRHEAEARAAEEASLRHAHLVVTVSEVLRDELLARGVEPGRIVTYPNCVDAERFDPQRFTADELLGVRARHGLEPGQLVASFLGTFGQWHGAEVLAEAIALLWRDDRRLFTQDGLRFLFVGDGLRAERTRELVAACGAQAFVRFAGAVPQSDAARYLAASDLLVSPHVPNPDGTPFFGSPTKIFEYMASARPIVASALNQIAEVLDGVALLVPPGDARQLAKGIARLVDEPELRSALAVGARERVESRYTWRHHVRAILDGVDRVL